MHGYLSYICSSWLDALQQRDGKHVQQVGELDAPARELGIR
jgi:hypothetical protein